MHTRPAARLMSAMCALLLIAGCNRSSDTAADHSRAPLAPTPRVAGDPSPQGNGGFVTGAFEFEAAKITAEIIAIDVPTRTVTIVGPEGGRGTIKASKTLKEFDSIRVGDRIDIRVAEEMAVFVRRKGDPPSVSESESIKVAAAGSTEAVAEVETIEVTAQVKTVDAAARSLSMLMPDGQIRTIKVHKTVDLAKIQPGDDIVARLTEAVMLDVVEK